MKSEDLATSVNTSPVIIRNLLGELIRAKLIISKEGKGGGFRLARPASQIGLDVVYTAVHCPAALTQNPRPEHKPCTVSCGIKRALEPVLDDVERDILISLRKRTLREIVDDILGG